MTNERYRKIQYIMRRLSYHIHICDDLHDEETTQRQNFGQHMEDEARKCQCNEDFLLAASNHILDAIDKLKQIDP